MENTSDHIRLEVINDIKTNLFFNITSVSEQDLRALNKSEQSLFFYIHPTVLGKSMSSEKRNDYINWGVFKSNPQTAPKGYITKLNEQNNTLYVEACQRILIAEIKSKDDDFWINANAVEQLRQIDPILYNNVNTPAVQTAIKDRQNTIYYVKKENNVRFAQSRY